MRKRTFQIWEFLAFTPRRSKLRSVTKSESNCATNGSQGAFIKPNFFQENGVCSYINMLPYHLITPTQTLGGLGDTPIQQKHYSDLESSSGTHSQDKH